MNCTGLDGGWNGEGAPTFLIVSHMKQEEEQGEAEGGTFTRSLHYSGHFAGFFWKTRTVQDSARESLSLRNDLSTVREAREYGKMRESDNISSDWTLAWTKWEQTPSLFLLRVVSKRVVPNRCAPRLRKADAQTARV